ncbi:MAG: hypothetical protein NT004_18605 [Bacteroidetes bacterium]|nr:hypothetical protein [Bacteroidota bacterium]
MLDSYPLIDAITVTILPAQNILPYLGQDPPGLTAKRFPPDSLSLFRCLNFIP